MSHELSTESGVVEMMYAKSGGTPWHSLGQASDVSTPRQGIITAHMTYEVETTEAYVKGPGGDFAPVEGHRFIRRTDTGRVFGHATPRYKPFQNLQAAEIMDAIISEGQATVETCGAIYHGALCWMLSHLPGSFEVVKGDTVRPYMALVWGHNGKVGIAGKLTPVRIVCKNTLEAAGFTNGQWAAAAAFYFRHTGDITIRIDEARAALGLIHKKTEETAEAYRAMAGKELSAQEIMAYFANIFPAPAVPEDETDKEERETYDTKKATWNERMMDLAQELEAGPGNEFARGSVWSAYNAIAHHVDFTYPVLKSGAISRPRQESVLFGGYAETKARALTAALALV
jgi:phage/plasmid-like protein (TIGR03299 family)